MTEQSETRFSAQKRDRGTHKCCYRQRASLREAFFRSRRRARPAGYGRAGARSLTRAVWAMVAASMPTTAATVPPIRRATGHIDAPPP